LIVDTHFTISGTVEGWAGYIGSFTHRQVLHPGTNRTWCRVTSLLRHNALPLHPAGSSSQHISRICRASICGRWWWKFTSYHNLCNYRRAVVQTCVNGDRLSQWRMAKFDPSQIPDPSVNRQKNLKQVIMSARRPSVQNIVQIRPLRASRQRGEV